MTAKPVCPLTQQATNPASREIRSAAGGTEHGPESSNHQDQKTGVAVRSIRDLKHSDGYG